MKLWFTNMLVNIQQQENFQNLSQMVLRAMQFELLKKSVPMLLVLPQEN